MFRYFASFLAAFFRPDGHRSAGALGGAKTEKQQKVDAIAS